MRIGFSGEIKDEREKKPLVNRETGDMNEQATVQESTINSKRNE